MEPQEQNQIPQTPVPKPPFNFFETDPKKNFAPWFLIFCGVLILIGLSLAGYFKYKAYESYKLGKSFEKQLEVQDKYSGWKTYRNDKYHFEFKYPPELFAHTYEFEDLHIVDLHEDAGGTKLFISIFPKERCTKHTLLQWFSSLNCDYSNFTFDYYSKNKSSFKNVVSGKEVVIDGETGFQLETCTSNCAIYTFIPDINKNKSPSLFVVQGPPGEKYNSILNTIKFIPLGVEGVYHEVPALFSVEGLTSNKWSLSQELSVYYYINRGQNRRIQNIKVPLKKVTIEGLSNEELQKVLRSFISYYGKHLEANGWESNIEIGKNTIYGMENEFFPNPAFNTGLDYFVKDENTFRIMGIRHSVVAKGDGPGGGDEGYMYCPCDLTLSTYVTDPISNNVVNQ